ncbi:hypothetical protein [Enterococcus rivorum]|uniref:Bacteriocin n=1 Tax=Enterococcus rivorum TaxID=762845 RepID=A0A1E5KWX6_9ENTE|nr:hypothetical protein [Enterococcus rivorum]MBP2097286.1 hypothetical protein [Enterococcus rivorum]OEH82362.1 hypothetical protein BCR26_02725 [Enterococcus rivorum]
MKKLSEEQSSSVVAGLVYDGNIFYVNGTRQSCAHYCSKGRRQHNVYKSGGTWYITHLCTSAP